MHHTHTHTLLSSAPVSFYSPFSYANVIATVNARLKPERVNFEALLIMPVQRVPRYSLLLSVRLCRGIGQRERERSVACVWVTSARKREREREREREKSEPSLERERRSEGKDRPSFEREREREREN